MNFLKINHNNYLILQNEYLKILEIIKESKNFKFVDNAIIEKKIENRYKKLFSSNDYELIISKFKIIYLLK